MEILSRDSLVLGGFAGIKEHRLVTDSRVFSGRKKPETLEGLGNMVYLADARYLPRGESGMHSHSEVDVISVIIEGRVSHEGSMEHGKDLEAGDVQVQRAGGEGFDHNEINPDSSRNRMLQIWALPEEAGQPAAYKAYTPQKDGITRIYGGKKDQTDTFDSHTLIDIVHLKAGKSIERSARQLIYVVTGQANIDETLSETIHLANDGDLVRTSNVTITALEDTQIVIISVRD